MVVLRGDEDEAVEVGELGGPGPGVGVLRIDHRRRDGLVEQGQVEVGDVDQLVLGVAAAQGVVIDPLGDRGAGPIRPGWIRE